jgi:hypothetical protein
VTDWREVVMARYVDARKRNGFSSGRFRRDLHPLQFSCTKEYAAFLQAAAQQVNVNRSTFVRRALAVGMASVLKVDVRDILYHSPKPRPFGPIRQVGLGAGEHDMGDGIESWCPHPGCDGEHLRG